MPAVGVRLLISGAAYLVKIAGLAASLMLVVASGLTQSALAANRDALWAVVHNFCLPAYSAIGLAFPCTEVNIANGVERGFAVLRLPSSATHLLVVPTARISGIESPLLLSGNAPNYWEAAWSVRHFVEEGAHRQLTRDKIGMAINSVAHRSQDQLHIHVACIDRSVAMILHQHETEIHGSWSFLSSPLLGRGFTAMKIETDDLANVNPFKLLARAVAPPKASMDSQTLIVVGATFRDGRPGFYLLAAGPSAASGNGEVLLDDRCRF
jgi:CDP-diacylglycerol pyrophosphatase